MTFEAHWHLRDVKSVFCQKDATNPVKQNRSMFPRPACLCISCSEVLVHWQFQDCKLAQQISQTKSVRTLGPGSVLDCRGSNVSFVCSCYVSFFAVKFWLGTGSCLCFQWQLLSSCPSSLRFSFWETRQRCTSTVLSGFCKPLESAQPTSSRLSSSFPLFTPSKLPVLWR